MEKVFSLFLLISVFMVIVISCGDKLDPVFDISPDDDDDDETITYNQHIKPLLDTYCIGCHAGYLQGADRNGAPPQVNLDTYAGAVASAERGNIRIQGGTMPPGSGGIPQADRELFQKWIDQGLLE